MPREMGAWEVKDDVLAWVLQRNRTDKRILLDWLAGYRLGGPTLAIFTMGKLGTQ